MRIKLKEVINTISKKLQISKSKISLEAYFKAIDTEVEKGCDISTKKSLIRREYLNDLYSGNFLGGLNIIIYVEGMNILTFEIKDIKPNTKLDNIEIDELMAVTTTYSCIGPGFYYYYPYLILNEIYCKKEDIKTFIEKVSLDTNNIEIKMLPKDFNRQDKNEKDFLKKYNLDFLNENFFKNLDKKEDLEF